MKSINKDTRIIDLTVGEFEDWINGIIAEKTSEAIKSEKKYVYGIVGIMELFDCSQSTAQRLKNGKIKDACVQYGRKIVVDVKKAIELFAKNECVIN